MTTSEGQLRRRILLGAAAVALLAGGVFVGIQLGGDEDDDTDVTAGADVTTTSADTTSTSTTTTEADDGAPVVPTAAGQELIDLIATGQSRSYTARYQTHDPTSQLGTLAVDVWRDGTRVRQDALVEVEGRSVESSAFVDGDEVRACQRGNGQPWQCEDVPRESAPDVDGRIRVAVAELADKTSGGTEATIAGQPARCYQVTDHDGTVMELCVTEGGVPARLVSGEARVELLSFVEGVPDGIFTPPA